MLPKKPLKNTIACIAACLVFSANSKADHNRSLTVLGIGLMATGSPAMITGFGGYKLIDLFNKSLVPELEQLKLEKFEELEAMSREAFEQFKSLKEDAFGPASISLKHISLEEWVARSGKKIVEIISDSTNDQTYKLDREFAQNFFNTAAVKRISADKDIYAIAGMSETEYLDFFNDLLGVNGEFDFKSMHEFDRMLIHYNEQLMAETDEKLKLVDEFAVLEQEESYVYTQVEINQKKKNQLEKQIGCVESDIQDSSEEAFEEMKNNGVLSPNDDMILKKAVSFYLHKLEEERDFLSLKRQKFELQTCLNGEAIRELENEKSLKVKDIENLRELEINWENLKSFEKIIISFNVSLNRTLEGLRKKKDEIDNYQPLENLREIRSNRETALKKLEGSRRFQSLTENIISFLKNREADESGAYEYDRNRYFANARVKLQEEKNQLIAYNGEIRALYYNALLESSNFERQKYLFSLIDKISEVVKNTIILETTPKAINILRDQTEDVFGVLGKTIGSEKLARDIAISLEASLKKSVRELSFKEYRVLGWLHSPTMTIVDTISTESLTSIISSSLKSAELQINDVELIDDLKERILIQRVNYVVEEQTKRFVDEAKKSLVFESLHLSMFIERGTDKFDDYSSKKLKTFREEKIPHLAFTDEAKNYSLLVGAVGTAMVVSGGSLVYFSLPSK
ncbi:MAG: hypothetical protein AB8G05_16365 [Oligoflexales bacterium]